MFSTLAVTSQTVSWIDFVDGIFNRIEEVTCFNYEYWFDNLSSDVSRETSEDRLRIKSYNPIFDNCRNKKQL